MPNNDDYTIYPEEYANAFREQWYILQNIDKIKDKFANYIYEQLILQNSSVQKYYGKLKESIYARNAALKIILENTIYCGDLFYSFFVLCNPKDGQPSLVVDIYEFSPINTYSKQESLLVEYINDSKEDDISLFPIILAGKGAVYGAKTAATDKLVNLSKNVARKSRGLQSLAHHYSSGHATRMRVNRSIRGKVAQKRAFAELFKKSEAYTKYASRYKKVGFFLLKDRAKATSKSRFRLVSKLDMFKPETLHAPTVADGEIAMIKKIIPDELDVYCKKNNNYQSIINQQYFEQGY